MPASLHPTCTRSRRRLRLAMAVAWACGLGWAACMAAPARAQERHYLIFDGHTYMSDQLDDAMRSPVTATRPKSLPDGGYVVPRSADGHYYISGFINGFPVVFLIDTGAGMSVLPANMARNAGLRAGLMVTFSTAGGYAQSSVTEGNQLVVGPFLVGDAKVAVQEKLDVPLLGMDVLNRFQVSYSKGMMVLRPDR